MGKLKNSPWFLEMLYQASQEHKQMLIEEEIKQIEVDHEQVTD